MSSEHGTTDNHHAFVIQYKSSTATCFSWPIWTKRNHSDKAEQANKILPATGFTFNLCCTWNIRFPLGEVKQVKQTAKEELCSVLWETGLPR